MLPMANQDEGCQDSLAWRPSCGGYARLYWELQIALRIYDPADDSSNGSEFGLTAGGWDNWRARGGSGALWWCEPTPEPTFLFRIRFRAGTSALRMELWVRKEFDEYSPNNQKSLYECTAPPIIEVRYCGEQRGERRHAANAFDDYVGIVYRPMGPTDKLKAEREQAGEGALSSETKDERPSQRCMTARPLARQPRFTQIHARARADAARRTVGLFARFRSHPSHHCFLSTNAPAAVWVIVNVEEWDIRLPTAHHRHLPPAGGSLMPDVPSWAWH